jgi:opine dehydrogenase
MNITVMGSGNGGMALAFEWAQNGHRVAVYAHPGHVDNSEAVRERGGITSEGRLEGFAPIAYSGTDVEAAMADTDVVFVVGPAFATETLARVAGPHLRPGMTIVVCPGSCAGALAFKRAAGLSAHDDGLVVGETSTLPYAARADGDGNVRVFNRFDTGLFAAAVPRTGNRRLLEVLRQVYPGATEAASFLQTTLQNGNPVIHPAVTLSNAALLERTGGDFLFYEEGITPGVGRLMHAVDEERQAIARALGLAILSEPEIGVEQGYMAEANYTTGYSTAPGFRGIKAPGQLDSRYLTEDVGYTLVFFTDLARRFDTPTPVMDAVIEVTSAVLGRDLRGDAGRTMRTLGLDRLSDDELLRL